MGLGVGTKLGGDTGGGQDAGEEGAMLVQESGGRSLKGDGA